MYNPYLVIPFLTWAITQTIKFCLQAFGGRLDFRYLYSSGGMPSVHSAVVTSLAATALARAGAASEMFGLSAIFAAIVMYDSLGVRRASGEHAAALNMIIDGLRDRVRLDHPDLKIREILGHKPVEVIVGALIGTLLGIVFNLPYLRPLTQFLGATPGKFPMYITFGVGVALVVLSLLTRLILPRRYAGYRAIKDFARRLFTIMQTIGWLAIVLALAQYQNLPALRIQLWPILTLAVLVGAIAWLYSSYRHSLPAALATEAAAAKKRKWLPVPKKRKK